VCVFNNYAHFQDNSTGVTGHCKQSFCVLLSTFDDNKDANIVNAFIYYLGVCLLKTA